MLLLQNQNAITADIRREDEALIITDQYTDETILITADNIESFILGLQELTNK